MARQYARAGTHNGRARGTVKAVSTVNWGGRGIQLRRVEIRTRGTHFSFFRSFARRFHSFDELSNRARRFFLDLIRPKISTIERKKFKTCELFSKTWYPTTFHVSRVWTTEGEAKRSDSCEGGAERRGLMAGNSGRPEAGSLSLGASSSSAERKRCRVISEQARGGREMDARIVLAWQRDAGTPSPRFCFHAAARGRRLSIQMRWAYAMLIFRSAAKR